MTIKDFSRPGTRQKLKKGVKTIWQYSRQLFAVSGVNGISHIALAKTNPRRVLWIIIFTMAVIGWFYQTTLLLELYYKYRTTVKIEVEKEPEMVFPGITICNANRIRKSVFCSKYEERCEEGNVELTEEETFDVTLEFMKEGKKLELGHQIEDSIISCKFTGTPELNTEECLEYFSYLYDPNIGNCYVLASGNKRKLRVTEPDAWHDITGITFLLNNEPEEYLNEYLDSRGFTVTVHENMEYPEIATHGVHVVPNHITHFAIEKVTTLLMAKPYKTNCTKFETLPFHTLTKYELSPRICTVECLMAQQRKQCGHGYVSDNVVLFSEHMPYDPASVTKEDKECAERVSDNSRKYCNTLCGVPCRDVHYNINHNEAEVEFDIIINDEEVLEAYRNRSNVEKDPTVSELHIHFQSMEHRVFKHLPEFTTETLFSYLGGITGGWLGISLLEFCAFLEGLLSVFIFSFKYCKPKSRNKKRKGRRTPRKIEPVYQRQCHCQYGPPDYGTLVLGVPMPPSPSSPRTIQIVPFEYLQR